MANNGAADRRQWVSMAERLARPVLSALARGKLRATMPVEVGPTGKADERRTFTHLEAVGRLLTGLGPWLELPADQDEEGRLRSELGELALRGLEVASDPKSPDRLNFLHGGQPLVDAGFLAHALLRAPQHLWASLPAAAQRNVVACLKETRAIKPPESNWLMFPAMIEAFLRHAGEAWEPERVDHALTSHMHWYKGDGTYGDGSDFHWDYYNSFVIQPMLVDVLEAVGHERAEWAAMRPAVLARARRYAAVLERLIAPDGTFPPIGRSICYRCGVFQLLGQVALRHELPAHVTPAQARCGMTAVIGRTLGAAGTFDENGWLRIGLAGHQPGLAEGYISTGSLYLCSAGLLPLGLPADDPFWTDPPAEWTAKKIWAGEDAAADHHL